MPAPTRALALALLAALVASAPVRAAQTTAFVYTTDFGSGGLSTVDLDTRAVTPNVPPVNVQDEICGDATIRWFEGRVYVINRTLGCDNVTVFDPDQGYALVRQFSTGNGTNPHDIAFISATKAYVTLYDADSIEIANPTSGAHLGSISLAQFADADGKPEMDHMIRIGNRVFISVQRLDRNNGYEPGNAKVVVIDATADTVLDVDPVTPGRQAIALTGKDPVSSFAFDRFSGRLLLSCVGHFFQADGGIEWIDPVALVSDGFAITEAALGGDVGDLGWNGRAHSYAVVSDASFNTSVVSWSAITGLRIGTVFTAAGLAECEANDRGELYICDRDDEDPGLYVYSTANDQPLAGPFLTGLPPFQVIFDEATDRVAAAPAPAPRLDLEIGPNPTHGPISFSMVPPRSGRARLEIFDLSGRRLRDWELDATPAAPIEVRWDLRDARGGRVPCGIFLARVGIGDISVVRRVVVVY